MFVDEPEKELKKIALGFKIYSRKVADLIIFKIKIKSNCDYIKNSCQI